MSVITINGQQVDVGDDYDKLSPAEQQDTQAEIARQLGHHEEAQQETTKKEEEANAPVAPFDVSNSQSAIRQYAIDPALAAGSALVSNYGKPALELGGAALGGYKGIQAINAYKANTAVNQLNGMLDAYNKMTHNVRQYEKMGQAVPQELKTAQETLGRQLEVAQSKIPGYNAPASPVRPGVSPNVPANGTLPVSRPGIPGGAPVTGSVAPPPGITPPAPPVGGVAAQQGETFLQRMAQQFGGIAQRVAPVLNNPVTRAVGAGLNMATPAMNFAMPYQMAAHEMEKIRANPQAPEYVNNPYAMQIRGEAPTMGHAGAMNRRRALQQMPSLQQGNE